MGYAGTWLDTHYKIRKKAQYKGCGDEPNPQATDQASHSDSHGYVLAACMAWRPNAIDTIKISFI